MVNLAIWPRRSSKVPGNETLMEITEVNLRGAGRNPWGPWEEYKRQGCDARQTCSADTWDKEWRGTPQQSEVRLKNVATRLPSPGMVPIIVGLNAMRLERGGSPRAGKRKEKETWQKYLCSRDYRFVPMAGVTGGATKPSC